MVNAAASKTSAHPKACGVRLLNDEVPVRWMSSHWERAWLHLSATAAAHRADPRALLRSSSQQTPLVMWTDVQRALARTSLKGPTGSVKASQFHQLIRATYRMLEAEPFLFAGVITARVQGWHAGAWTVENQPRRLHARSTELDRHTMDSLGQGQAWVSESSLLFLLGIDWEFAASADPDLAYSHALVACGRIGHGLLLEGQTMGMQARMTPAVRESAAADLLQLDETRDCLYLLSIAEPDER